MNSSLSFLVSAKCSQLVHSGLEIATQSFRAKMADVKTATLVPLVPYKNCAGFVNTTYT